VIYLYGIAETGARSPDVAGLEDEPVSVLDAGPVAGLVSRHERAAVDPEPEALWSHDRVLENAMEHGPVLPARFGSTFADTDALIALLEREGPRLSGQLERVRGCVELAVRLSLPLADRPEPQTGGEYLKARLAQRDESRAAVEMALEPLAEHAVLSQRNPASDTTTLTASYLVRATEVDRFAEEVRELASRHSELSLSCTGPWPPYSFVGDESE
jgi:Gas vesicle synthesis protein GvpL/GvpF